MECNKDEAIRAREIAQKKMQNNDFDGARKFAVKAQQLFPELENINHLLTVCNVHCSAQTSILGSEKNWYSILQVDRLADEATIKKQYRKLALMLHPDKNQFPGAEAAFKLIGEAHLILSDRGKRSLYDSRTATLFKSAQAKQPSHQVNNNPPAQKQCGVQNNIPNGFSTQFNGLTHHQTTQSNSTVVRECFWTCCPFCGTRYQYYREFVNRAMRCQKCLKQFIGYDIAAEGVPRGTNQNQSASQGVPPRSNYSQPASQGVPSRSNYSQPSVAAGTHKTGAQKTTGYPSSNLGPQGTPSNRKMGSDLGTRVNSAEAGPSINIQKNPVGGGTEGFTSHKADAMKPGEDAHPCNNKRKRGRKVEAESSESCGTSSSCDCDSEEMAIQQNVSNAGAGQSSGVNGFYEPRRSSRQKHHQVSYIESEGDDNDLESPTKIRREEKSSDSEKQQEALNPHCAPLKQKESVPSKGSSPEGNTQISKHQMTGNTVAASNNFAKQVEVIDDSESDADDSESDADPGSKSYQCPDPEFNDFDKLREETCFAVNQFWACYDTIDGMPRFYAQIIKVYSPGFKLGFSWLEANPDDRSEKKWVKKQLPVGCGKYKHGDIEESTNRFTFSHPVFCERGRKKGTFVVYPRHGETWALFKDWNINWSSDPENHQKFEYEIVEVLSDFVEGVGIKVAFLDKVKGFVSLFSPRSESTPGRILIRPKELFKFSHQIPSFKMTGTEKEGVPEGCFELDPAALPIDDCNENPNP